MKLELHHTDGTFKTIDLGGKPSTVGVHGLSKKNEPDTVTIPRAEHERLKDCERRAWLYRHRIAHERGGVFEFFVTGEGWHRFKGDGHPIPEGMRAIIDAAMRANGDANA